MQRLYDVIHNLVTLQMSDNNIKPYVNQAQTVVNELKLLVTSDDTKKMIEKLDNVCMINVLHGLHKNYEPVQSHFLISLKIPSIKNLINRLIRLPSREGTRVNASQTGDESSAFASNCKRSSLVHLL